MRSWATWTTALQNSRQFMKSVSFGISATSSGVIRYQSLWPISKLLGSDEYRPPSPVTSTGHIDEYLAMYVPTFEFFCDSDMHNKSASRAWWPSDPSLWTYGNNSENMMKLNWKKRIQIRIENRMNYCYNLQIVVSLTLFHHSLVDAMMLNRKTNPANWHFASKPHTIDSVKWRAAFRHRSDTSHQGSKSEFSAMDAKMIHELATIGDENAWLTVHIILIAPTERHRNICRRRAIMF